MSRIHQSRVRKAHNISRHWTEKENRLLGTMSDVELARRLKRGVTGVTQQRLKLGISFYKSDRELIRLLGHQARKICAYIKKAKCLRVANAWQKWEVAFLGKMSDRDVARKIGRTYDAVQIRRNKLGIRPFGYVHNPIPPWKQDEIKLLGTMTDLQLARRLGRKKHQVLAKRRELKIPSFKHRSQVRSWKPWEIKLLGRFTDLKVAQRLGCPQNIVCIKRLKLGIPARHPKPVCRAWTSAEEKLLGTASDLEIARILKRTRTSVHSRRNRLGILFRSGKKMNFQTLTVT